MNNITYSRDRALDQAVEKENHLRAAINLKNLIKSEPSKSLPLSTISHHKLSLSIPIRPIDFIRRHPFLFEEFYPTPTLPHVRLTPYIIDLDDEEQQICQLDSFLNDSADRLLRLLMLSRVNRLPIAAVESITWDLGIPRDFPQSIVPKFPDYFKLDGHGFIELVCWSNQLSVSVMEKRAIKNKDEIYTKGMPLAFTLQNSRGFECDKRYSEWLHQWQNLPYFSPYEMEPEVSSCSDECDKWVCGVIHELMHLLCSKRMEKEELLVLGKHLGLRWKFNRALMFHPGIFYISCKNNSETVVLREGFKRDLLVEKHPLMEMRCRYAHLMNKMKKVVKKGRHTRKDRENGSVGDEQKGGSNGGDGEESSDLKEEEHEDCSSRSRGFHGRRKSEVESIASSTNSGDGGGDGDFKIRRIGSTNSGDGGGDGHFQIRRIGSTNSGDGGGDGDFKIRRIGSTNSGDGGGDGHFKIRRISSSTGDGGGDVGFKRRCSSNGSSGGGSGRSFKGRRSTRTEFCKEGEKESLYKGRMDVDERYSDRGKKGSNFRRGGKKDKECKERRNVRM